MRLYDVAHCEIGQGVDRWSQSASTFKRCARHFGVGRYRTQLPPLRMQLGEGIPVNAKGRPYVTDQLLEILRRQYEEQIRAASDRFGAILPHRGVRTGDREGELPTHPEVESGAQTKDAVATGTPAPYGTPVGRQSPSAGAASASCRAARGERSFDEPSTASTARQAARPHAAAAARVAVAHRSDGGERFSARCRRRMQLHRGRGGSPDRPGAPYLTVAGRLWGSALRGPGLLCSPPRLRLR